MSPGWALPSNAVLARVIDSAPRLSDIARLVEVRQGLASAERRAIETAGPLADTATDWAGLHRALAAAGLRYTATASGAVIEVGNGRAAKASVYRGTMRAMLEKRLGPFEAADPTLVITPRPAVPAPGVDPRLTKAVRERRKHATRARADYDRRAEPVAHLPLLRDELFGRRPRASADLRRTAADLGFPVPVVAPLRLPPPPPHDPASLLGRFHAIVGADRYRVVARGVRSAGVDAAVFQAGSIDAVAVDFDEIRRFESRGAALAIDMSSRLEVFVVLDRIPADGLARLRQDGLRPRLVTTDRAGDHQVLLVAPRAGGPYDVAAVACRGSGAREEV